MIRFLGLPIVEVAFPEKAARIQRRWLIPVAVFVAIVVASAGFYYTDATSAAMKSLTCMALVIVLHEALHYAAGYALGGRPYAAWARRPGTRMLNPAIGYATNLSRRSLLLVSLAPQLITFAAIAAFVLSPELRAYALVAFGLNVGGALADFSICALDDEDVSRLLSQGPKCDDAEGPPQNEMRSHGTRDSTSRSSVQGSSL